MTNSLFTPLTLKGLALANRIVMAPMTRSFSPGGVPGPDVAACYLSEPRRGRSRADRYRGHLSAARRRGFRSAAPASVCDEVLAGWREVVNQVHDGGGKNFSRLWHVRDV